ncbi:hypothetical protein Bhyg_12333 [Pseudolycoriella hygida]|uniref:CUB domain-containing protein n=1 Tax=Pseudolycoriella hygida TaxID=35572 RepID=A0A9Q0S0S0_9DIPT|nr:hypothetical protein Bhyg_12333 [Pseudolycoriella hygida]
MVTRNTILLILSVVCFCEITIAQKCPDFVESTTCGGNIIGDSGIIRYNHSGYGENSGCVWLIRSNISSTVQVRLLADTFSTNQFIEINHVFLDGEIGGNSGSYIRHGDFSPREFNGPVILVRFASLKIYNATINATVPSFTLFYRGCGTNIVNPPTFTHYLRERSPGEREVVTYPKDGGLYQPNQLVTYLGLRKDRAILNNSEGEWKVKVLYQDMQTSSYCLFGDSLKFFSGGFNMLTALDEKNEFIWRFCQRNSNQTHVLPKVSPKYGNVYPDNVGILAIFASNGYQEGKGFVFEW